MPRKKRRAVGRASRKAATRDMSTRKNPKGGTRGVPSPPRLLTGEMPGGLLAGGVPGIRKPSDF
jgi:hypothetical protein